LSDFDSQLLWYRILVAATIPRRAIIFRKGCAVCALRWRNCSLQIRPARRAAFRGDDFFVREDEVNTIKSTAVILVLAGVLYGVYTALNAPEPLAPPAGMTRQDIDDLAPPDLDFSGIGGGDAGEPLPGPPAILPLEQDHHSPADTSRTSPGASSIYSRAHEPSPPSDSSNVQTSFERPEARDPQPGTASANPQGIAQSASVDPSESAGPPSTVPPDSTPPGSAPQETTPQARVSLTGHELRRDLVVAEELVAASKFRSALTLLSPYAAATDLDAAARGQVLAWLDALAAKVIYSHDHLLEVPYVVQGDETLFTISKRLNVSAELLQNINGVADPRVVLPGTRLKVVPGPFRAVANLSTSEVTMYLGDLYAGRFPFTLGNEPPQPGLYEVQDRQPDKTYYGPEGQTIAANDPTNPYGQCWIDLGTNASIHGSPLSAAPGSPMLGCISLSPQDARDVYALLTRGSQVSIVR
jgi:LysM repeat protein